jgi:MmyB-like transcription regulator ligand binding domain
VMRLTLHPEGLASRVGNLAEWRTHLLDRLRQQIDLTADQRLVELMSELSGYPSGSGSCESTPLRSGIVVPFRIRTRLGELSFFTTTMIFGTPLDVTLAELAIESFFPADSATVKRVQLLEREALQ